MVKIIAKSERGVIVEMSNDDFSQLCYAAEKSFDSSMPTIGNSFEVSIIRNAMLDFAKVEGLTKDVESISAKTQSILARLGIMEEQKKRGK